VKVQCRECATDFNGISFIKKKLKIPTAAVVALSAAIGGGTVAKVHDERLPYAAEYKLMQMCVEGSNKVVTSKQWFGQIDTCGCAIESAIDIVGIGLNRNEPDEVVAAFGSAMKASINKCD
jgi:hypothetical protein